MAPENCTKTSKKDSSMKCSTSSKLLEHHFFIDSVLLLMMMMVWTQSVCKDGSVDDHLINRIDSQNLL